MKKAIIIIICAVLVMPGMTQGASIIVTNTNLQTDAAHAMFNSEGTFIPGTTTGNIRVGYFTLADTAIQDAWNAGDLSLLNSNFVQFSATIGMNDFSIGLDGVFENTVSGNSTDYTGQNISLWISTGSNFSDMDAEYLIYRFDTAFPLNTVFNVPAFLGTTDGNLLVGEYGNYSHDYGFGGGSLPGFNTVAVIPEPSTYVLIMLGLGGLILLRRKSGRGSRNAA